MSKANPIFNLSALAYLMLLAVPALAAGRVVDASKAGAVGDGVTLNTANIQKVIDDTAAAGGGVVDFPAGTYLTGTIELKSHVTLRLEKDAVLLGSVNAADYRNVDPFIDGSGNPMGHALIVAVGAVHVGIEGQGTVDGQGRKLASSQKPYTIRPFLLRWVRSSNVVVKDVHLINPGAWTLNFFETKGAIVDGVTIRSRDQKLHNNDGVNIDSSQDIRVTNCDVISGDDALVIKSTGATPTRGISATNCKLSSHTNAIKLGTESYGGFEDVTVSHCEITNTDMAGIALYAVDGGDLRKVSISDVTMDGVSVPISIRLGARLKTFRPGQQPRAKPGSLRDVVIRNVEAKNVRMIGIMVNGVPGYPVDHIELANIRLELPGGGTETAASVQLPEKEAAYPEFNMFGKTLPAFGMYVRHARDIAFRDVHMQALAPDARPATVFIDVEEAR